jgi:hypothetical protein
MAKLASNAEFKKMQAQVVEGIIAPSGSSFYKDMIKFNEPGKTYRFRLIYTTEPEYNRTTPFIEVWRHTIKDSAGRTSGCVCPKTFGIPKYWEVCPCCDIGSSYYQEFQKTGDPAMKQLSGQMRSMLRGYALVYVIADPITPANNGTVKKIFFDGRGKKFFDLEINGITTEKDEKTKKPIISNDRLGFDAFDLEKGYDLIVVTETADRFVNCKYSFARKATSIIENMTQADLNNVNKMIEDMEFDSLLNVKYVEGEAIEFYNKYVAKKADTTTPIQSLGKSVSQTVIDDLVNDNDRQEVSETVEDDIPYETVSTPPPAPKPVPTVPKPTRPEPAGLATKEVDDLLSELGLDM